MDRHTTTAPLATLAGCCEKLSPNALKIFESIKTHYPPDPWKCPQWSAEGLVFDNGWYDLRKGEDRGKLISRYEHQIGSTIVVFARNNKDKKRKLTRSIFHFKLSKRWIELAVLLHELDFQIETLDLLE